MSLVWYKVLPAHFGGQKGIANFNEALGKQVNLICLCSKNNEPGSLKSYRVFNCLPVSKWQIINPAVWLKIIVFSYRQGITHVILEHPYHAIAGVLLKLTGKKIITHSHNLEYERFKQAEKKGWKWVYIIEKLAYKISDLILFKTREDQQEAIKKFKIRKDKTMLLPYGVERKNLEDKSIAKAKIHTRHNIPLQHKILLFNGTLDYAPNAEAVVNITKQLIPQLRKTGLEFTVIITGRLHDESYSYISNLKARNFIFAGLVNDVEHYFLAADVYINTVHEGGGVQTKTLEALSYHLNVVAWQHMLLGIDYNITNGKIFKASYPDWPAFAIQTNQATKKQEPTSEDFFEHNSFNKFVIQLANWLH